MNKQQLAAKIWESANQMRSKIEANDYKDYILGFIFYKYLSDKAVQFAKKSDFTDEDIKALSEEETDTVDYFKDNLGYFIAYENLFSTWISKGRDFSVANVRDALHAFNSRLISKNHKKLFDGVFETLQTGLSKLGESAGAQTKAISKLIHLIDSIPMDGKQDYDVLGFIYEYLISKFAANAGKKAGEFYTPSEVSQLMSDIIANHLKDKKEIAIYDPTSGSGSLLITIGRSVSRYIDNKNNIKYYAQELKQNTYNLTRMNLIMRGILPNNIVTRNADTLQDDWPYFDENDKVNSYHPLYVDAVVSNPPYSQKCVSDNKENDARYARFGLAPQGKADYAFLLHDLFHIKPDGIMTIILPHGVLFRGGEEGVIRKNLIEFNNIDAIIGLPANIFFGTGIPTVILVLRQKRQNSDILILDASKGFIKEGKNNKLRASDIKRIADTVIKRENNPKYSRVVSRDEIRENDYNLNIPRYVDSSEEAESWDIYSSMFGGIPEKEIDRLSKYWDAFPDLRASLFSKTSDAYAELTTSAVKKAMTEHPNIQAFVQNFNAAFADFTPFLKKELIDQVETVPITREEAILSEAIFERLKNTTLVDKYEAYQLLNDEWTQIASDLESIQTEGFKVTKQVDPNMVMKKKKGKDVEVQEGWEGHILPFELVQATYLKAELDQLKTQENRLVEITASYEEILDSLSEEEKEADTIKEDGSGFVNAAVTKEAKQLQAEIKKNGAFAAESYEAKIITVAALILEERAVKKTLKTDAATLHLRTKTTIENLSDEQAQELLERKWIHPLVTALQHLPVMMMDELTTKVLALVEKYSTTYSEVVEQIQEAESTLASLMDDLVGNEFDTKGLNAFKSLLKGQ